MVLPEGTDVSKTYLLFSVKDQSPVLGEGLLLGEALLPLNDIIKEDGDDSLKVVCFFSSMLNDGQWFQFSNFRIKGKSNWD